MLENHGNWVKSRVNPKYKILFSIVINIHLLRKVAVLEKILNCWGVLGVVMAWCHTYRNNQINPRIRFEPRKARFEKSITCYSRKADLVLKKHISMPKIISFRLFWPFWNQKYHIILLAQRNLAPINLMIVVVNLRYSDM